MYYAMLFPVKNVNSAQIVDGKFLPYPMECLLRRLIFLEGCQRNMKTRNSNEPVSPPVYLSIVAHLY